MTYRRNVLITGCASGIGRHLATVLGENGHWVMATDIDEAGLEEAADRMEWEVNGIETALLDVAEADDWHRVVDEIIDDRGRLDLLINSAGYLHPGYAFELEPEEMDKQIDVNLKGTMYGTRVVGETMVEQTTGHIVNFGSLASLAPIPGLAPYTASKFGVRGFSIAVAQELDEHGVDVTAVMPDAVDTPMLEKEADFEEAAVSFSGRSYLTVEDVEEAVMDRVLPDRPLEVTIPPSRGAMARVVNLVPEILDVIYPLFRKIGLAKQEAYDSR